MKRSVYWCKHCGIPVIEQEICPICLNSMKLVSPNGICNPVYKQERRLISCIIEEGVDDANIWYLGSSYYLINGKRRRAPYVDFYKSKKHLDYADKLRQDIVVDDEPVNYELYIKANSSYLNDLIYEAEEYIENLVNSLNNSTDKCYIPTISFSGGKDSTVVSKVVREKFQDESIIHFFGDTT